MWEINLWEINLWEINLWEINLWEMNLWEMKLWEINLWEMKLCPIHRAFFARWVGGHKGQPSANPRFVSYQVPGERFFFAGVTDPRSLFYPHTMEFKILELEREPIEFDLELPPGAVDFGDEAEQIGNLATSGSAEVIHEHRGPKDIVADIRLRGHFAGNFQVPCARCIEPVEIPLASDFDLIFRPLGADSDPPERSITASETEIGYYQKDSLLLEDVLREQVLLSLPVRTLCKPDCKGLCPRCGANRNLQPCSCDEGPSDPRWEALTDLRSRIKS